MRGLNLALLVCIYVTSSSALASSNGTLTNSPYVGLSSSYYYYMNDLNMCTSSSAGSLIYFRTYYQTAYVKAWMSSSKNVNSNGCMLAFKAYSNYKLKLRFTRGSISDCSTTLNIYASSGTNGPLLASYTCNTRLTSSYFHTDEPYVTIQLLNPNYSNAFDFTLSIENYRSLSGWDIFGIIIGCLFFILIIVACIGCMKKKRQQRREYSPLLSQPTAVPTAVPAGGAVIVTPAPRPPAVIVAPGRRRGPVVVGHRHGPGPGRRGRTTVIVPAPAPAPIVVPVAQPAPYVASYGAIPTTNPQPAGAAMPQPPTYSAQPAGAAPPPSNQPAGAAPLGFESGNAPPPYPT